MSLRAEIKNTSPEFLKSATQRGEFYQALADITEAFQSIKQRVALLEKRDTEFKAISERLDALEGGGIRYRGVHQRAQTYTKGDVVTHKGSSWIALRAIKEIEEPGSCDGWQLMAKAGKDAS